MLKPTSTKPTPVSSRADRDAAAAGPGAGITQHNSDRFRTSDLFKITLGGQRYEEFTRHQGCDFASGKLTEEVFWRAIQTRDGGYDGLFYYGVRTTGVYCRPSCASRQPKRKNIFFFALPEAARQAGFRACLRCRPDETVIRDPQAELTQSLCRLIDQHLEEPLNFAALSAQVKLSQFHLQRLFKKLMGITPRQYAEARRADLFKTRVKGGQSVTEAMYEAGYGSSSRLYEKAASQVGMTPATYRKGGKGMKIKYTIAECPLGLLLGCANRQRDLFRDAGRKARRTDRRPARRFSQAEIARDETSLRAQVNALLAHLAGPAGASRLAARCAGNGFSEKGLGRIAPHSLRPDGLVQRDRSPDRAAFSNTRCGPRLRDKPGGARHTLSPSRS